jgi:hypothetical protein
MLLLRFQTEQLPQQEAWLTTFRLSDGLIRGSGFRLRDNMSDPRIEQAQTTEELKEITV